MASATDFRDTLRNTIAACLPALGDFGFFDVVYGDEVIRTVAAHEDPRIEGLLAPTRWVKQDRTDMNLCALSTGEPALHPEVADGWYRKVAANEHHLALLRELAFVSMITVPVRYGAELVGALTLFMGRSGRRHTAEDLEFASEIALMAATVVVNSRLREEAQRAHRRLELLARAGAVLSRSLDPDETLRTIGDALVPAIADWCRIDLLDDNGVLQRRLAYHSDPARAERALALARELRASPRTTGTMPWVLRTGQSHYGRFDTPEVLADPALSRFTREFGMLAHFIIPLVARGRTIGVMGVIQAESGRDLSAEDRALILEMGQRAALALDNARLYSAANAANRAKDEFLAMLGHELRNPLAPIATALELMARRDPQAHVEERRVIGRQVAHLSRLIEDLLDVSRITRGKVRLRQEPVDMKAIVANALEVTRPVFARHRHGVELTLPDGPAVVMGDAVRLTQVLCNLLTNSAKFTPLEGRVRLVMRSDGGWVEITVEDTGSGIAPELLPQVFELFVQGRQAIDRQGGGLGLGLAIVRTMVRMHGGEVAAHSDGPGRGARFTVRLPACDETPIPTAAPKLAEPAGAAQGRILVVDDNVDAAETLADLLRVMGYDVHCVHHSRDAVGAVTTFAPQLALLDIGLPGVDGYELARM
ncbi:MAG TPA: ATP-binding protein, partial [Ramlibacter sp.]|nr:ATP-binding protein [Ramlibacter sp.]